MTFVLIILKFLKKKIGFWLLFPKGLNLFISFCNNLFTDFNVNTIESNTKWDCKLQTNFPGKDIGLLKPNLINNLFDDLLLFLQKETKKYDIKWMKNLVYSSKNLGSRSLPFQLKTRKF